MRTKTPSTVIGTVNIVLTTVVLTGRSRLFRSESAVNSDFENNTITITAKHSGDGTGRTGLIIVNEGEHLHLEHALAKGSLDINGGSGVQLSVARFRCPADWPCG